MQGRIFRIVENQNGWKFGFITSEGQDYYFDNRGLLEGTMEDFFEDDVVSFEPTVNPKDNTQLMAKKVNLNQKETMDSKKTIIRIESNDYEADNEYVAFEQEESKNLSWYKACKSDKLILKNFSIDEENIMMKLSKVLYLTNAGHFITRNKGIEYGYCLFGPTKQFVLQLGFEKVEFSLIFCDKEDFQRRTLEESFSYLTNNVIPKVRISAHFYVLVTKCKNIVNEIEKPEIQGTIQCSVVPFTYDELLSESESDLENLLLTRFKKFLFERNYFSYSEPIKERNFLFGAREQYAKSIADRCLSGEHSGIFGLRKSGKTSVVNMVKQELDLRSVLYVSYRCAEFLRNSWDKSLEKIASDICEKYEMPKSDSYTESDAIQKFSDDLFKCVTKNGSNNKIVLIFDEIEQISLDSTYDEYWSNSISFHLFWSGIITFCEKYPNRMAVIVAGINPSISEVDFLATTIGKVAPRNPMYKKLSNENFLRPFATEQTKRMVNELGKYMGLSFDDEVCYELQKDFGGHPYFTRQMCKTIVRHIIDNNIRDINKGLFKIERPLYNAVKTSGIYEVESNQWCVDILRELKTFYSKEYQMLINIANRDSATLNAIRKNASVIDHLIGYGVVKYDPISREMDIYIDIVKDYLLKQKEYRKTFIEMTSDEIDEEIQLGIRECEQPLRNLIRDVLSTWYNPSDAVKFIKETPKYSKDNSRNDLTSIDLNQALDPRYVTLHFSTLKDIITFESKSAFGNHYEKFKNKLFPYTKQEFRAYMDNIYVARNAADHHFLVHNEATLENFRSSVKGIKDILRPLGYIE